MAVEDVEIKFQFECQDEMMQQLLWSNPTLDQLGGLLPFDSAQFYRSQLLVL